jgi:transposase
MLATIGTGHDFKNGRQVAAWIGLTPGQYSSGGTARLGRITKAGDKYLRSLLVMGAKAVLSGLGDKQDRFSRWARTLVERRGYWKAVVAIAANRIIAKAARDDTRSKRLMSLPGIGPNTASAMLASIGGGHDFKNGRQVAAWIGLTPGQYSSGGTARLGRITKAGDKYLRSLLVMGAKAVLSGLGDKQDRFSRWAQEPGRASRLLEGGGGDCREECAAGLGGAAVRRGFPAQGRRCLNGETSKASAGRQRKERKECAAGAAARNHRCTACVDVKRVGPAPGAPD